MQPYACGCSPEPEYIEHLCYEHVYMECHAPDGNPGECPNCFRARMLSVDTTPATQLLSHARRPGNPDHIRLAEPGEFDDAPGLTQHSKVRDRQ